MSRVSAAMPSRPKLPRPQMKMRAPLVRAMVWVPPAASCGGVRGR